MTAATIGYDIADWGPRFAHLAKPQVTALCATSTDIETKGDAKRADQPIRRILRDVMSRRRKVAIETGYDTRSGRFLKAPLEPWACENPRAAQILYREISDAADGTLNIWDYTGNDLERLDYLKAEQLITIDRRGWITMLGDPIPHPTRKYPGAPCGDTRAKAGKQLREHADFLIVAALLRLGDGADTRLICTEANRHKHRNCPELAAYRFLSIDTCRRALRRLAAKGAIAILRPCRRFRARRQWQTEPALYTIGETMQGDQWRAEIKAAQARNAKARRRQHGKPKPPRVKAGMVRQATDKNRTTPCPTYA